MLQCSTHVSYNQVLQHVNFNMLSIGTSHTYGWSLFPAHISKFRMDGSMDGSMEELSVGKVPEGSAMASASCFVVIWCECLWRVLWWYPIVWGRFKATPSMCEGLLHASSLCISSLCINRNSASTCWGKRWIRRSLALVGVKLFSLSNYFRLGCHPKNLVSVNHSKKQHCQFASSLQKCFAEDVQQKIKFGIEMEKVETQQLLNIQKKISERDMRIASHSPRLSL